MFACFKTNGYLKFLMDSLKLESKNSASISVFYLITLVGTSVDWHILDVSKLKISFTISSLHNSENQKGIVDLSLHTFPIVSMLGWSIQTNITKKYNHQVPLIFKRHLGISKKRIRLKVCSKADKEINYTWQNAQFFTLWEKESTY